MIAQTRARFGSVVTRVLSVDGAGPPAVLLHGFADNADTWLGVLSRLSREGRRAYAVDLPGFGEATARTDGPMLAQFDDFADALLDELGPAVLVGNSLGAATAVRAASRRPDAVRALMALDDPLSAQHLIARLVRRREPSAAFWSRLGKVPIPAGTVRWATRRATPGVLYGPGVRPDPAVLAQWSRTMSGFPAVVTLSRHAFRYAAETRTGHAGIDVSCPTLIVHGARDRIIPVHSSRALHRLIPGSDFVVLPKSGHCPQLDDPDEVVRLLLTLGNA